MFALVDLSGGVRIWDTVTGKLRVRLPQAGRSAWAMALSPDGQTIATNNGAAIQLWDISTRRVRARLIPDDEPAPRSVSDLVFSPDGHTLAAASPGRVDLWDTTTGHMESRLNTSASTMTFSRVIVNTCGSVEVVQAA